MKPTPESRRSFNGLSGAARAALAMGDRERAATLVRQLDALCGRGRCDRPELAELKAAVERPWP